MAGEDGAGAVDLFGEDDAGELVRQGHLAEGEKELRFGAGVFGPAIRGADGEENLLSAVVAELAEMGGEGFGGELFAGGVEQDDVDGCAGGALVGEGEELRFGGEEARLAGVVTRGTFNEVGEQRVELTLLGAGALRADGGEKNLHRGSSQRDELSSSLW